MRHEIELLRCNYFPDVGPAVEIGVMWNGQEISQVFTNPLTLSEMNVDLIQEPAMAIRYLLFYLMSMGHTETTMGSVVGKKLVIETTNVVQQQISLV
jgi:hypothetical protein